MQENTQEVGVDGVVRGAWRIDPSRSRVEFQTRMFGRLSTVKGHFDRFDGTLDLERDPAVVLTIEADSLATGNARRDKHLRSDDFFDVERSPEVRFVSDSVALDGDRLKVDGRLHAAGKSAPLEVEATLKQDDGEIELQASAEIDQRLLGMTFSPLRTIGTPSRLVVEGRLVRDR